MEKVIDDFYQLSEKKSNLIIVTLASNASKSTNVIDNRGLLHAYLNLFLNKEEKISLASLNEYFQDPIIIKDDIDPQQQKVMIINLDFKLTDESMVQFEGKGADSTKSLIIDEIGPLFLANNELLVFKFLRQLKRPFKRILVFVNNNVISHQLKTKLHYIADINIDLMYQPSDDYYEAEIDSPVLSCVKSGIKTLAPSKIVQSNLAFQLQRHNSLGGLSILFKPYQIKNEDELLGDSSPIESLPAKLGSLPFNLALTDEQKKARDSVVLPYTDIAQDPNKSKIFYYPDKNDDVDEEDPDDDLNI